MACPWFFAAGNIKRRGRRSRLRTCEFAGGFLYKALSFSSVLHTVLCSILYLAVLVFFLLTALGVLRTRIFLILLAGLPLLVHIIMDLSDYEGFFLFLPELSVLLLMASLLCLALRLRPAGKGAKP